MTTPIAAENRERLRQGKALLARTVHWETRTGVHFRFVDCPWCCNAHCHMNSAEGRVYYAPCGRANRGKMYEIAGE